MQESRPNADTIHTIQATHLGLLERVDAPRLGCQLAQHDLGPRAPLVARLARLRVDVLQGDAVDDRLGAADGRDVAGAHLDVDDLRGGGGGWRF